MAKPNNPNPGPGAAARRQIGVNTAVEKVRAAGYQVIGPAELDNFAESVLVDAVWALKENNGHPSAAWSAGEQLAVALVLFDHKFIADMGHTPVTAAKRIRAGMTGRVDLTSWLSEIRRRIDVETLRPTTADQGESP